MPPKKRPRSPSTTPLPSTEAAPTEPSSITEPQWEAMHALFTHVWDHRTPEGIETSKLFQRMVNKRFVPDYYDTIKEPIALSTIRQKLDKRLYTNVTAFVRDFALIPYNAQVFNRVDSGAFQDALVLKAVLEQQLQSMIEKELISKEEATLPYLGEIPTYEDAPVDDADGEGEEDEDSDEDGEEDDDEDEPDLDDEGRPMVKRRRGRPPGSRTKRDKEGGDEGDGKRARGRPPKLLTPTEARISAILKGIRKPKNSHGNIIIRSFDRLPDKATMPEYYAEIKNPMAFDVLKRKVKRKKYSTLEAFMADVNLMLNNAKEYNTDDSQIFKDAVQLQVEAGRLYDAETAKPDDNFADDEGKLPMPNGILHNGELYKVGDWVHIQNPNDLTKPIPTQIYRTYKNPAGVNMVNACWYYRPEQTVHSFDKHFYQNEVVKTGRYRDHPVDSVEGKCFVMFYTRFFKGRPRGLPEGMEIYVCRDRYNEERHQFNTIKTWASCLPDEVRDKDYEMDLFDHARRMKKHPSPLAYLLKDDQKETDELPKVQWGAEGAPPKIGAVHRRPKNEKDSPAPEPTPPPPAKIEPPAPKPIQQTANAYRGDVLAKGGASMNGTANGTARSYTAKRPGATSTYPLSAAAASPGSVSSLPHRPPSTNPASSFNSPLASAQQAAQLPTRPTSSLQQSSSYQSNNFTANQGQNLQQSQATSTAIAPNANSNTSLATGSQYSSLYRSSMSTGTNYRDPPPIEVYALPDQANLSIPAEVRERYQRDEAGRVLFFTTPPVLPSSAPDASGADGGAVGGHSVRYLAAKARRADEIKRRRIEIAEEAEEGARAAAEYSNTAQTQMVDQISTLRHKALAQLERQLAEGVLAPAVGSENGPQALLLGESELGDLSAAQKAMSEQMRAVDANRVMRTEGRRVKLGQEFDAARGYRDDWDLRIT